MNLIRISQHFFKFYKGLIRGNNKLTHLPLPYTTLARCGQVPLWGLEMRQLRSLALVYGVDVIYERPATSSASSAPRLNDVAHQPPALDYQAHLDRVLLRMPDPGGLIQSTCLATVYGWSACLIHRRR
jgi:hypothetical protein